MKAKTVSWKRACAILRRASGIKINLGIVTDDYFVDENEILVYGESWISSDDNRAVRVIGGGKELVFRGVDESVIELMPLFPKEIA